MACKCGSVFLVALLLQIILLHQSHAAQSKANCNSFDTCKYPYIVIFDAGSTGTRVHVFQFERDSSLRALAKVVSHKNKKTRSGSLGALVNAPNRIGEHLQPLVDFARAEVPQESHSETMMVLGATAGVRALDHAQESVIVRATAAVLRRTPFKVYADMPNNQLAQVLSGIDEAYHGWVAANFLLRNFERKDWRETNGMLDLGGGSTQIALIPQVDFLVRSFEFKVGQVSPNPKYGWDNAHMAIYLRSYHNLGKSAATLEMMGYSKEIQRAPLYKSPCLHPDFTHQFTFALVSINVTGDSDTMAATRWSKCQAKARLPLAKVPVQVAPMSTTGSAPIYMAVSAFYYVSKSLSKLGHLARKIPGVVSVGQLTSAARSVCVDPPRKGKYDGYLCLDSAYIVTLLKEGYKFSDSQEPLISNSVNGIDASWPLGMAATYVTGRDRLEVPVFASETKEKWQF